MSVVRAVPCVSMGIQQQMLHSSLAPCSAGSKSACSKWGMQQEHFITGSADDALCSNFDNDMDSLIGTQVSDEASMESYQIFENGMVGAGTAEICTEWWPSTKQLRSSRNIAYQRTYLDR